MTPRRSTFCGGALLAILTAVGCATERGTTEARIGSELQWHGRIYRGTDGVGGDQSSIATATMTSLTGGDENVRATVTGRGGLQPGSYPWHVHAGACGSDSAILGSADEYQPLEAAGAGIGTSTADFNASISPDGAYSVNIHRSPDDMTVVACGNLERG